MLSLTLKLQRLQIPKDPWIASTRIWSSDIFQPVEESNLAVPTLCTTTPVGLFLLLPLIEQSLPPFIYNHLLQTFPCPICRATSLTPVCIASPTSDQPTNRHESTVYNYHCSLRIGVLSERTSGSDTGKCLMLRNCMRPSLKWINGCAVAQSVLVQG